MSFILLKNKMYTTLSFHLYLKIIEQSLWIVLLHNKELLRIDIDPIFLWMKPYYNVKP